MVIYSCQFIKWESTNYGWVNTATGHLGTPPDGYGLVINPITKIWAANFNAFLEENSQSNSLVVQENGVVNNKLGNPMAVNGIDTVILPSLSMEERPHISQGQPLEVTEVSGAMASCHKEQRMLTSLAMMFSTA